MTTRTRDPRTKEELLDRMLSYDFDGDIRHLGAEEASLVRTAPNKLLLSFPKSGRIYELVARLPRTENHPRPAEERSFASSPDDWTVAPDDQPAGRTQDRSRPSPART